MTKMPTRIREAIETAYASGEIDHVDSRDAHILVDFARLGWLDGQITIEYLYGIASALSDWSARVEDVISAEFAESA